MFRLLTRSSIESSLVKLDGSSGGDKMVIIFGWAAGEMRHVKIYTRLYQSIMGHALVVTTPLGIGAQLKSEAQIMTQLKPLMQQLDALQPRQLWIHSFSNGGLIYASRLIELWEQTREPGILRGCIFDSAPSLDTSPKTPATVVSAAIGNAPSWFKAMVYYIIFGWIWILSKIGGLFGRMPDLHGYFGVPLLGRMKTPSLFLYSAADEITDANMLRDFLARRMDPKRSTSHDFQDSPHVQHFRHHRKEYSDLVHGFIKRTTVLN